MITHESDEPETCPLPTPRELRSAFSVSEATRRGILEARASVRAILHGDDPRLLVVVGPCSIHDPAAALDYARRLRHLQALHRDSLFLCMRGYFEKPRTTTGWKGLLNDPKLDGACDLSLGLRTARALLVQLAEFGLPIAGEALDPLAQDYLADLMTWSAIGARTTESQTHRELASGLAMPVGFKNGTDGGLDVAINAMRSAARGHTRLGIDEHGRAAVVRTRGNPHAHVVLRGGAAGPNYGAAHVTSASEKLRALGLPARLMVDCSHDNSLRDHRNQLRVADSVATQLHAGSDAIMGVMLESQLEEGRQDLQPGRPLRYGQSITDACIDFATTETILETLADAMRSRTRLVTRSPSDQVAPEHAASAC